MAKPPNFRPQRRNANRHTQRGLEALGKSIAEGGFIGAITAAADGEIFDGSARIETVQKDFAHAEPIVVDSDGSRPVIVRRTDIPTADAPLAKKLAIAANRIAAIDLEWDPEILAEINEEIDLSDLFYDNEISQILIEEEEIAPDDPNEVWDGMPQFAGGPLAIKSIHVHFETMDDYYQFAELIGQKLTDKTKSIWIPEKLDSIPSAYVAE